MHDALSSSKRARHVRQRPQPLDLGGEGEKSVALVIEHMALSHMVARKRQRLVARVPYREGKIAEQMIDAIGPHFL